MIKRLMDESIWLAILLLSVISVFVGIVATYIVFLLVALFSFLGALFQIMGGGYG